MIRELRKVKGFFRVFNIDVNFCLSFLYVRKFYFFNFMFINVCIYIVFFVFSVRNCDFYVGIKVISCFVYFNDSWYVNFFCYNSGMVSASFMISDNCVCFFYVRFLVWIGVICN